MGCVKHTFALDAFVPNASKILCPANIARNVLVYDLRPLTLILDDAEVDEIVGRPDREEGMRSIVTFPCSRRGRACFTQVVI